MHGSKAGVVYLVDSLRILAQSPLGQLKFVTIAEFRYHGENTVTTLKQAYHFNSHSYHKVREKDQGASFSRKENKTQPIDDA